MNQTAESSVLYIVATPIGNLLDITQRALQILATVNYIAVEDTRHSRTLLQHYGIQTPLLALHAHNEQQQTTKILDLLTTGHSVALISDAGTPLISDPGYLLVAKAHQHNIKVMPIPGACALIAALSAAGLPTDRFAFEGFLPVKTGARQARLETLKNEDRTMIFYEAPHRIVSFIQQLLAVFEAERPLVVVRELTKKFETIYSTTLAQGLLWLQADHHQQLGEFVVIVGGECQTKSSDELLPETYKILQTLLTELPASQAAALTAKITGERKNKLYEIAQVLKSK